VVGTAATLENRRDRATAMQTSTEHRHTGSDRFLGLCRHVGRST